MSDPNDPYAGGAVPPPAMGGGAITPPPAPGPPPGGGYVPPMPPPPGPPGGGYVPPMPPPPGGPGAYQQYQPGGFQPGGNAAEPGMRLLARFIDTVIVVAISIGISLAFGVSAAMTRGTTSWGVIILVGVLGNLIALAYGHGAAYGAMVWKSIGRRAVGALVVQVLVVMFYLCVAYGLRIDLPLRDALVIVPVSLVIQLAPVSINGFGVREAVFSYLFVRLGHAVDAALALSIAGAALLILASLPGGLLFLTRKGLMMSAPSSDMP